MPLLIVLAYLAGWFFTLPTAYRLLMEAVVGKSTPDNFDTWAAAALGTLMSLFWPFLIVVAMVRRIGMRMNERAHEEVRP